MWCCQYLEWTSNYSDTLIVELLGESWIECLEQRSENEYGWIQLDRLPRMSPDIICDEASWWFSRADIANDLDNKWSMSRVTSKFSVVTYSFKRHFVHLGVTRRRVLYTLLIVRSCACDCVCYLRIYHKSSSH